MYNLINKLTIIIADAGVIVGALIGVIVGVVLIGAAGYFGYTKYKQRPITGNTNGFSFSNKDFSVTESQPASNPTPQAVPNPYENDDVIDSVEIDEPAPRGGGYNFKYGKLSF